MSEVLQAQTNRPVCGYVISAPWRSSGKTLLSIGLARAARRCALSVQTFKKGPDYIDPLWLATASGTGCYNLDPWVQQQDELLDTFHRHCHSGSLALVEGTMGLHDGLRDDGSDSNAAIADLLELPVILVVDCRGMHRTVAALVNGIVQFSAKTRFAGIVLNRIKSERHEGKLQSAIGSHCDTRVIGVIPETRSIHIDERELGLIPAPEFKQTKTDQPTATGNCAFDCIEAAADLVSEYCDLDWLFRNVPAQTATEQLAPVISPVISPELAPEITPVSEPISSAQSVVTSRQAALRIGVARDEAFHFYYQDDLDTLRDKGAELIPLSPMRDDLPADLDGLIIGGGFPERHAQALEANERFRHALRQHINTGLVVHAECAGLMYLCRTLLLDDGNFAMVGCINADVTMGKKPVGRGYVQLQRYSEVADQHAQHVIFAHEFHHSRIAFDTPVAFSYRVLRGYGIDGSSDGVIHHNAHAGYAHFRHTRSNPWLDSFLQRVVDAKQLPESAAGASASFRH